jgi:hypothetical protein
MKKSIFSLFIAALFVFMLNSCGGGLGSHNNEYLGEIPSIEKNYYTEIDAKEKEMEESTDMEDSYALSKEIKLLEKELKTKVEKYVSANPLTKPLPFEAMDGMPYTVNEIKVNKAQAGNLNIKFSITINKDMKNKYGGMEKSLFTYYKAVDSEGKDIPNSATVATNFKRTPLKAGLEYEVFGSWQSDATMNMEDFAKVVQITKEEYDKKS